jgi:hypothetical protein
MKYLILIFTLFLSVQSFSSNFNVQQNRVVEWSLYSQKYYTNPFYDVDLVAIIKDSKGKILRLPAFWKGNGEWGFRFSSHDCGEYSFRTECSDLINKNLHNQSGTIRVFPYTGKNPLFANGPVKVASNKHYLEHYDGKPFFWLADSWWFGMSKRISYNDFCFLVNDRKQKGFSVIQFAIGFACDIAPFDVRDSNEGYKFNQSGLF